MRHGYTIGRLLLEALAALSVAGLAVSVGLRWAMPWLSGAWSIVAHAGLWLATAGGLMAWRTGLARRCATGAIVAPAVRVAGRWGVALMAVAGIALVGYGAWRWHEINNGEEGRGAGTTAEHAIVDTGRMVARELDGLLERAIQRGEKLSTDPMIIAALASGDRAALTRACNDAIRMATEVDAVVLCDPDGAILAVNTQYADGSPIAPDRVNRVLAAPLRDRRIVSSVLHHPSGAPASTLEFQTRCDITPALFDSSGLSVAHSVAVRGSDGRVVGVVSTRVRFDRIDALLCSTTIASGAGRAWLVNDAGDFLDEAFNRGIAAPIPRDVLGPITSVLAGGGAQETTLERDGTVYTLFRVGPRRALHDGGVQLMLSAPRQWVQHERNEGTIVAVGLPAGAGVLLLLTCATLRSRVEAVRRAEEARAALRESAALRSTLDQHSIFSVADAKGRIIDINDRFCAISGYTRAELLGRDHRILNSGLHPKAFWVEMWRTLASGQAWHGEVCNRAKDGSLYWVDSIIAPFVNAQGRIEKFVSIRSDITGRKRSEAELAETTQRLKLATHTAGVGIWDYDVVQNRLKWDEQMYRLYGAEDSDFAEAYESWLSGVHPEDRARCDEAIRRALRGERAFDTEFRVRWPDGTVRSIRAISTVQFDIAGRAVRMIGTNWDVTEQRESASKLQAVSDSLEEAQALARMGNWSYDVTSGRVSWSKVLYELFERDEAQGPPDYAGVLGDYDEESAKRLDAAVRRAATDGTPYSLLLRTSKAGASGRGARHVRGEGRVRRDASGMIVALYGTATDVTAEVENAESLRRARLDAEAANRAKSAFLANMSHEIRTPLTAILGYTDLLRDESHLASTMEQRGQAIETIRNAGAHLLTVINDILDLSKIEAEKMVIERVDTSLVGVLREVESLMRPKAVGKGVSLAAELSTPVPERIMSDPTRLRQILMNLAGNAVKFTEAGSVAIVVGVEPVEGVVGASRVNVEVRDTGPGMSVDQTQRLFQAFGQADATVTRKHGGTGLGLTICRRLAALMGGEVVLVETALGKGSCFRLSLPLEPVVGSPMATSLNTFGRSPRPDVEQVCLSGRILLAEDGPDNQRLIAFHLRKAGATVEIADNGRIALERIRASEQAGTPFDLLLTDMQMPEMDGYTLARTLRESGSRIPIVALTAHAMTEDREKCLEAGCDDYASKPIDKAALLATCFAWMTRASSASSGVKAA
jgi:PAS domain S-box-containing protein